MLLLALVLVPFMGSAVAALMPANARNREALLAGAVMLSGLAITVLLYFPLTRGELPFDPARLAGLIQKVHGGR